MNFLKFLYIIALTLFVFSCASNKNIAVNDFEGVSRVKAGDTLTIRWDFKNAHYVTIKEINQNFNSKDSMTFVPKRKTSLDFYAINKKDTVSLTWRVYVDIDEEVRKAEKEISKYPNSYVESDYFMGVHQDPKNLVPDRIKILGYDINNDKSISYKILLLDQFGNYLPGVTDDNLFIWNILNSCGEYEDEISTDQYSEKLIGDEKTALNILVDNSKAAEYNQSLLLNLKNGLTKSSSDLKASLAVFNQNYEELVPMTDSKDYENIKLQLIKNDGLSAVYKNLYQSIADIQFAKDVQHKAVILVTYSPNNAATIYNAKDVVTFARESKVPIYVIAIGNAIDTYSMKYLAYGTGGRYYSLETENIEEVNNIINEITFSLNAHYTIEVPKPITTDCEFYTLNLKLNFNDKIIEDEGNYINNPSWNGNSQQSLVIFKYKNNVVEDQYLSLINSMARVLNDNPQYSIELIGHSSIEDGDEKNNLEISKNRVESVKKIFLDLGVPEYQLKNKFLGSSKPIYYLPSTEWQQHYNRRVEVQWVKPGDMTYEIIAQEYWTEEEAQQKVNEWQKNGYRAYFERYLVNNRPSYKVKLWGFESKDQAAKEAKKLQTAYKFEFHVE